MSSYLQDITLAGSDTMNAPWGLDSRFTLVVLACDFFNIAKFAANRAVIGKKLADSGSPKPLTVRSAFRRFRSPVPTKRSQIPEDSDHLGGERRSIGALESGYGFEV